MPTSVDLTKYGKMEDFIQRATIISTLKVDTLTIAIGPEHHDLRLLDFKKPNLIIGRISFNVMCSHIENISLAIKNLQCKVNHLVQNEVCFKLKFKDSPIETPYTDPVVPNKLVKEEVSIYNWIAPEGEDKSSSLSIDKLLLSMVELRSSNINLNVYDTIFVENNELSDKEKFNLNYVTRNLRRISMVSNMKEVSETLLNNIKPKFTLIGYANLNFYKILSENDSNILKQSSRFFQKFSYLYNENKTAGGQGTQEQSIGTVAKTNSNGVPGQENNNPTTPLDLNNHESVIKFQVFEDITKTFSEDIYFQGNLIGKIEGSIVLKNIPLIRQIMCGVHTEKGFDISSIHLNLDTNLNRNYNSHKDGMNTVPPELMSLINQTNSLLSKLVSTTSLTTMSQSTKEANAQILQTMGEIKTTLSKSCKESCLYYNYLNNKDLYSAQKVMLELGLNILNLIENLNNDQRQVGFEILNFINNRAEFDLGTLKLCLFDNANTISLAEKSKITENFIQFLNKCLEFTLNKLTRGKNNDQESKSFVEFFLSVAYFRIPVFKKMFLEAISKDITDTYLYKMEEGEIQNDIDLNPINSLIDWENLFYKKLDTLNKEANSDLNDKIKDSETLVAKEEWKDRMSKRGLAFFSVVQNLEKYIQNKIVISRSIKWRNIPGFEVIINAIIHELKSRDVATYPTQLLELLTIFINDSDIINTFIKTIIMRTK